MIKAIRNITSVILAIILMVSTLQLSIYKMECLMSGASKISLSDFEDCNQNPRDDCSFTEKCCCFHQVDLNFDYDSNLSADKQFIAPTLIGEVKTISFPTVRVKEFESYQFNLPPPGGIEFLKEIQVFRL